MPRINYRKRHFITIQALTSNRKLKSLKLTISGYKEAELFPETLTCLKENGVELEHLQIDGLSHHEIFKIIPNPENLTSLALRVKNARFKSNDLISFAKNCKKLETFKIHFNFNYDNINPAVDISSFILAMDTFFIERQSALRSLAVDNIWVLLDGTCDMLRNLSLCQNLEALELDSPTITQSSLGSISKLPGLKKLAFKNLSIDPDIFGDFFWNLNKENLECLVINNCSSFNETEFKNMRKLHFPKLERVFMGCHNPRIWSEKLGIEEVIVQMKMNSPSIKSIMIENYENHVSDNFCLEMSSKFELLVCWFEEADRYGKQNQVDLELFLWKNNGSEYENYMEMKNDLSNWCHRNGMQDKTPITWRSHLPISYFDKPVIRKIVGTIKFPEGFLPPPITIRNIL